MPHSRTNRADKLMKIIVSLTTTFEREQSGLLHKSVHSLLNQEQPPDVLMLNISDHPYLNDSGFADTPQWVKDLPVTINWVENTGSYRKLLPAIRNAAAKDLVVTADDDVVYGTSWLKSLIQASKNNPEAIVCCRARKMKKNIFGKWQNYRNWPLVKKETRGHLISPTGCGGVAYTRNLLDLDFLFDQKFLELAPTTDDLWFRMAGMRKGSQVLVLPQVDRDNAYLAHKHGLDRDNFNRIRTRNRLKKFAQRHVVKIKNYFGINQTKNDIAWDEICSYSVQKTCGPQGSKKKHDQ